MGFIWKKATFLYTDMSVIPNNYAGKVLAVKTVLSECARTILSTNTGWQLDSSHTGQDLANDSPIDVNSLTRSDKEPIFAYYFVNTISGDKMMLLFDYGQYEQSSTYNPLSTNYAVKFSIFNDSMTTNYVYAYQYTAGLCVSIISGKYTSEEFGEDCAVSSFLPAHATRLLGLGDYNSDINIAKERASTNYGSFLNYYFGSSTEGNCLILVQKSENIINNRPLPLRIYGKIYSKLYNLEDTDDYGAIKIWNSYTNFTTYGGIPTDSTTYASNFSVSAHTRCGTASYPTVSALVNPVSPTWLSGSNVFLDADANANKWFSQFFILQYNAEGLNNYTYSKSAISPTLNKTIKLPNPIIAFCYQTEWMLQNYGVVPGCGIKGTLDDKVISFIPQDSSLCPYPKGTLIDDGYSVVTAAGGVCLGWDPSNDPIDNPWYVAPV